MGSESHARALLSDPSLPAATLHEIAQAHPSLAPELASHPQAYEELIAWAQARETNSTRLVDNHEGKVIGLDKCPRCGSTHMRYDIPSQALVCQDCRNAVQGVNVAERFGSSENIENLAGRTTSSGAMSILNTEAQVTIKCQGCGAEVSIDTDESLEARCHWCRQALSVNNQIPNGAVPDGILPFRITKEDAVERVREFTSSRRFFAQKRFTEEFTPENVIGVYLPYIVADARFTGVVSGTAEKHIRSYSESSGNDSRTTYYDYDLYQVERDLAILADDIALEASSKRQIDTASNTNNVINAVQPFPIEDTVEFRAHYLTGFNSERRDMDMGALNERLEDTMLTVIRAKADETVEDYKKRGVRWEHEKAELLGTHEAAVYLPVWLYSYVEENAVNPRTKEHGPLIHYIAVNGVTGQTMGSIPVNKGKLFGFACLIGAVVGIPSTILAFGAAIFL